MITRVGMAPAREGLTTTEFVERWRTGHADVAAQIPGLRRYVQLHPILRDGRHLLGHPGFDACSLLDFDDIEAMHAGFASETYRGAVRADEADLIDRRGFALLVGERHVGAATAADSPVLVATFYRSRPGADPALLQGQLVDVLPRLGLREREHVLAISDGPTVTNSAGDALLLAGFPTVTDALNWSTDPAGAGVVRRALAHVVSGVEAVVATPHRLV